MLDVRQQILNRQLVSPWTRRPLEWRDEGLVTSDGAERFALLGGVPLLIDADRQRQYLAAAGGRMAAEYAGGETGRRVDTCEDYRAPAAVAAFRRVVADRPAGALCVAVGGGPTRRHPNLVNVNIGPFPNVDVVADAYALPYADAVVDAVTCEAVLEHLEFPDAAVGEMFRVLRPGGEVFAATPFLQAYHGYPDHFQNFTHRGHVRLFARAGFDVVSSGVCDGPACVIADLAVRYAQTYMSPAWLRRALAPGLGLFFRMVRRRDRGLIRHPAADAMASTTYAHLKKPWPAAPR